MSLCLCHYLRLLLPVSLPLCFPYSLIWFSVSLLCVVLSLPVFVSVSLSVSLCLCLTLPLGVYLSFYLLWSRLRLHLSASILPLILCLGLSASCPFRPLCMRVWEHR